MGVPGKSPHKRPVHRAAGRLRGGHGCLVAERGRSPSPDWPPTWAARRADSLFRSDRVGAAGKASKKKGRALSLLSGNGVSHTDRIQR